MIVCAPCLSLFSEGACGNMDAADAKAYAKIVENGIQAVETVRELRMTGYTGDQLFVLAYDEGQTERTAEAAGVRPVFPDSDDPEMAGTQLFRSNAAELRERIASMGFSEQESAYYEEQLETGKVLVVAQTPRL
ncbi:general stress protein [Saccharibacillus alkalitolerans]|uniref:General stress protein n=1 Tax=Saccharibacillus alkalitolerans TaxID=2705290 RepID=A0ABX0FAB2_9BACL|nr:general stress protein [Saccharibacillus alkalitolerans]NGZ77872.1 general stress protein [Saccharibacillus alkalitolerans]